MKLIFKQRMFSWFDSYDIYEESGAVAYEVKGEFALGHCLRIYDSWGDEVGMIKKRYLLSSRNLKCMKGKNISAASAKN